MVGDLLRRVAGWVCLGLVAAFVLLGYYFGNVRFAPLAGGFLILAAVCLIERGEEAVCSIERGEEPVSNGVHPGADSGIHRASR